jgi:hypothetical protein
MERHPHSAYRARGHRGIPRFNVTEHPTAAWTAQQIIEAFPEDTAPRYMIRDRDGIYGQEFRRRVEGMGIEEVVTAPQSPWQNPYAERLGGSVRRECLNHVIVEICPARDSTERSALTESVASASSFMEMILAPPNDGHRAAGYRPGEKQPANTGQKTRCLDEALGRRS